MGGIRGQRKRINSHSFIHNIGATVNRQNNQIYIANGEPLRSDAQTGCHNAVTHTLSSQNNKQHINTRGATYTVYNNQWGAYHISSSSSITRQISKYKCKTMGEKAGCHSIHWLIGWRQLLSSALNVGAAYHKQKNKEIIQRGYWSQPHLDSVKNC